MKNKRYYVLLTSEVVPFPNMSGEFTVMDRLDKEHIRHALKTDAKMLLVPVDYKSKVENGAVGIVIDIEQFLDIRDQANATVLFKAQGERIRLEDYTMDEIGFRTACATECPFDDVIDDTVAFDELLKTVSSSLSKHPLYPQMVSEYDVSFTKEGINGTIDFCANKLKGPFTVELQLFKELNTAKRLAYFQFAINLDHELFETEIRAINKVREAMDENQREYYIREQIRALSEELGDENEEENYLAKIEALDTTPENKEKFRREVRRLKRTAPASPDMALIKNYLDVALELPWGVYTEDNEDLKEAEKVLDEDHYGLEKVKERLIEALAVRKLSKEGRSPIICLVGPPGIGKTSIAKSIARAMNKKYVRLSFGGVRDEAEIRGHRKTYVGAMPGRIITSIQSAGSMNPVFLMDEIDKMAADYKGDPASALLEVLDPAQNVNFRDHFLEVPFDLSKVLFITTANTLDTISRPLLDRMEVIEMSGYTAPEKLEIAWRYLLPRAIEQNGVDENWFSLEKDVIRHIIEFYTREAGVRALEKQLNKIVRKVAKRFVSDENTPKIIVTKDNLNEFLGEPTVLPPKGARENEVGVVTGLAWNSVGGDTLESEVTISKGKGNLVLTGSLGDVIKESATIALSYVKCNAHAYGISEDFFDTHDVHLHLPEGAVPKDGPSAGITFVTAIMSAVTGKKVYGNVAMTGEVSLRGKVLPIGGLKEKTLAALREGIVKILLPEDNRKDMHEVVDEVKEKIAFHFVKNVKEVLDEAIIWNE